MNRSKRKTYNQTYYAKNREKILAKAKSRGQAKGIGNANVLSLFEEKANPVREELAKVRFKLPPVGVWLTGLLAVVLSYYLVNESAKFYSSVEGSRAEAWLKALILEGAAILFCVTKSRSWVCDLGQKVMLVAIYAYSIWMISGSVIHSAVQQQRELNTAKAITQEIAQEISRLESVREQLWKSDRVSLARKYELNISDLRLKLDQARKTIVQLPSESTIWNTLATLVVFRVLVMISNFFSLNQFSRRFRAWARTG